MARFTKIPTDTFQKLQINAAILTTDFTPSSGELGADGQIGATTGGINFTATPTYTDFGDDIDNCPNILNSGAMICNRLKKIPRKQPFSEHLKACFCPDMST